MILFFKGNEIVAPGRAVQLLHALGIFHLGLEVLASYSAVKKIWMHRDWAVCKKIRMHHGLHPGCSVSIRDAQPVPEGLEDCAHHGLIENHLWLVILSTLLPPRAA